MGCMLGRSGERGRNRENEGRGGRERESGGKWREEERSRERGKQGRAGVLQYPPFLLQYPPLTESTGSTAPAPWPSPSSPPPMGGWSTSCRTQSAPPAHARWGGRALSQTPARDADSAEPSHWGPGRHQQRLLAALSWQSESQGMCLIPSTCCPCCCVHDCC